MTQELNVIAFISGGKDSFFSLLHCIANGHRIIALANLYPSTHHGGFKEDTDLNSLMYQTVGHTLIPLYADVLPFPLYRQEIRGTAVNQAKDYCVPENYSPQLGTPYSGTKEDETESMIILLNRIKTDFPEANAVCSGAILSTYQRTRIESVALRLGLVPLAYLWQYPQLPTPKPRKEGLLEDMSAVGLDARIIKVASGGLDEDLLWENVCTGSTRKRISKAIKRFGGSVLGEGGEFETLVIDGPSPIMRGQLVVQEDQRKTVQGGGGEAWMNLAGGCVTMKKDEHTEDIDWLEKLRIPDLLDEPFRELLGTLDHEDYNRKKAALNQSSSPSAGSNHGWKAEHCICAGKWTTRISNIHAPYVGNDIERQMGEIKIILMGILDRILDRSVHDIVFTTILLRSMNDFQVVNQKYAELFAGKPNPPARVTIACGDSLPQGVHVMVSVVVCLQPHEYRQCLHVQSRSYWAPANIGPYSQATSVPLEADSAGTLVYIAGQIPLVPASMDIVTRASLPKEQVFLPNLADFPLQTTLALQHLLRIGKAMSVGWWTGAVAFLVAGDNDIRHKAAISALAWRAIHARRDRSEVGDSSTTSNYADFDVWNQRHINSWNLKTEDGGGVLPDSSLLSAVSVKNTETRDSHSVIPPFFAVEVAQLPRGSDIEWQALGISQAPVKFFEMVSEHGISVTGRLFRVEGSDNPL
ncbi:MAG: hypothetical protein LQ338_000158 [Usnochroma carphineum]|nr:MAG: hypothetical protein LQ338_000158 [Usnochroma carphineum]